MTFSGHCVEYFSSSFLFFFIVTGFLACIQCSTLVKYGVEICIVGVVSCHNDLEHIWAHDLWSWYGHHKVSLSGCQANGFKNRECIPDVGKEEYRRELVQGGAECRMCRLFMQGISDLSRYDEVECSSRVAVFV